MPSPSPPPSSRSQGFFLARHHFAGANEPIDSLAILPFENVGGNPDAEYLSDGLTESLINSISQLPNLKVIARSSVFRYKGKTVDPGVVGRELSTRAILTGRIVDVATISPSAPNSPTRATTATSGASSTT